MNKVTINLEFSDILKHSYSGQIKNNNFKHTIILKNGGVIMQEGKKGLKSYKQICRNFPGEHLD